ncbi:MAG: dTMP kinase [Chloroflexota bacterium]
MFITFEGPDGAGKTTQIRRLAAALRADGQQVVTTYEPGGTPLGEAIRSLLLTPASAQSIVPRSEVLLFAAARAQLVDLVIGPALARGAIVLCDRFSDSTIAYQVGGRGLPIEAVRELLGFATDRLTPDLTFLLDIDVAEGLSRKRGVTTDRLEREEISFHQRVRQTYVTLAAAEPDRIEILDARRSIDELALAISQRVETARITGQGGRARGRRIREEEI